MTEDVVPIYVCMCKYVNIYVNEKRSHKFQGKEGNKAGFGGRKMKKGEIMQLYYNLKK